MSLPYIGQQITVYACSLFTISGAVGNGINILVFSSVRSYRSNPCTFYFLMISILNIIYITMFPIYRAVMLGTGFDLTRSSSSWCKMRQFIASNVVLSSLIHSSLATIDQFLATSHNVRLRNFSNIKWTRRIVCIVTVVCFFHATPILFLYDISPNSKTCMSLNSAYAIYYPIYVIAMLCIIPVSVMITFGYLAYRNIHSTIVLAQQQADRQLIQMILVQVVLAFISFVPFGSSNAYNLITANMTKDANRLVNESFATTILSMTPYIYFAGSCYMFLISSSRFRRAVKSRLCCCVRSNQVRPSQPLNVGPQVLRTKSRVGTTFT